MQITNLFIDHQVLGNPVVGFIQDHIHAKPIIVKGPEAVFEVLLKSPDPIAQGKKLLFLTRNKGAFIRDCPGTSNYLCCNYKILHIGTYCTMDCAYCILQAYFHPPLLQYFVNHDDLLDSLNDAFSQKTVMRIGTGEFTDSLIWEKTYPFSETLISMFSTQAHAVLELKTKTVNIENFLELKHNRKTILSWSLNTEKMIQQLERGTASLSARLKAARKCEAKGYPLAFHFDPMIIYPGCEVDYKHLIKDLFRNISPDNVVWVSLGTFRFVPDLKWIIENRFSSSTLAYGEFIKGMDGKMRYFKPLRIQLYKTIISTIRSYSKDVIIYFCMEDNEVWGKTLGFLPEESMGVSHILNISAIKQCGLQDNANGT